MNQRENEIIKFLQAHFGHWIKAQELASYVKVTPRTIRNNIAEIKQQYPNCIASGPQGYKLTKLISLDTPTETGEGRTAALFLTLLKHSQAGSDLYELASQLYVSESTLNSDIQDLRKVLPKESLRISTKKSRVYLLGSERAKRKYMISLLYAEGDFKEQLKLSVQHMIGYISLSELEATIQNCLKNNGITLNSYSLYNIALHFAISIERIHQGHAIQTNEQVKDIADTPAYQLGSEVADNVSKRYGIPFNEKEKEYLSLLFIGIQRQGDDASLLGNYVSPNIISTLESVLKSVEYTYHVDLSDRDFFIKLAVHVQSLYYRAKYDMSIRNESTQDIKMAYPLIYDISVYISSLIQEKLKINFSDDEIAFIALHLGALLESQKKLKNPIRIGLIAENYHTIDQMVRERLEATLGKKVSIVDPTATENTDYDVMVTTSRQTASIHAGSVFIHPFPTSSDLLKVQNRVLALKRKDRIQLLYQYIDRFIAKDLFFNQVDPADLTPLGLRKQMVSRMVRHHYVNRAYLTSVEKREQMSPTSFPSGVAVPHSVTLDAKKSGVSIMTLQEPIKWAQYPVRIVIMVAIDPRESQAYNTFFEKFVEVLSESVNAKLLSEVEGFDEFIFKLKSMISAQEA